MAVSVEADEAYLKTAQEVAINHKLCPLVGRAAGSMFGGSLMAVFNARIAFRIMGICAGVVAIAYASLYYLFLRKEEIKALSEKKEKDANNETENDVMMKDVEKVGSSQKENTKEVAVDAHDVHLKPKERTERADSVSSQASVISANLSLSHPI